MKASKILTDNRPIGHQSNIVEGSDGPVTDSRQISPHQQLRGILMVSKMQSSVYQNRGGSQHHAPSVNDVRFGGIDTKISVDQKLVPAPRPTLENAAAQEVIPPAMSTVTGTDRANLASWSSAFTYLMEGFTLYGASLHPNAYFPVERYQAEKSIPQPWGISQREWRRFISLALRSLLAAWWHSSLNTLPIGSRPMNPRSATADNILVEFDGVTSPHVAQPSRRNWLTSSWEVIAALWTHWRREHEIRKTVSVLAECDDRTLRDIGIPHRSQIKQTIRCCRDCSCRRLCVPKTISEFGQN
jgi:uncharacterized protein YjiS (DUF1127 family)